VAVFELLEMTPDLREAVFSGESTARLRELSVTSGGMATLRADALRKVLKGTTSLDEVIRVLSRAGSTA
jgi:type IV pilus assembly protein PilB